VNKKIIIIKSGRAIKQKKKNVFQEHYAYHQQCNAKHRERASERAKEKEN
jgi:hypothetical protein